MTGRARLAALIVEDSAADAELIAHELERAGYDVIWDRVDTAPGFAAALSGREWHIILCDYSLPAFSVGPALEMISETAPGVPLVVVSGSIGEEATVDLLKAGARDVVLKQNLARLAAVIRRELAEARERHRRQEAEHALEASREHLELALEVAGMASWERDLESLNARWLFGFDRLLGLEEGRFAGGYENFLEFVHPDDRAKLDAAFTRSVESGTDYEAEFRITRGDGTLRWAESRARIIGGNRKVLGVTMDITERKIVEESLRARSRQQDALLRLGHAALRVSDSEELLQHAVAEVAKTLGVEYASVLELDPGSDELVLRAGSGFGDGLVGRVTVPTGPGSQAGFTLLSNDVIVVETFETETRFERGRLLRERDVASGISTVIFGEQRLWGVLSAHSKRPRSFAGSETSFVKAVASLLSVAIERSSSERQRADAEARYRLLVEQIPAVTYADLVEPFGKPVYVSPQIEALFGVDPADWLAAEDFETWLQFVHPDDRVRVEQRTRELSSGDAKDLEYRILRRDGGVAWVHEVARMVAGDRNRPALVHGVMFDVTDFRNSEAELERSRKLLDDAASDRRRLLEALVRAQEEERARVSIDIHDDVVQVITALALRLDLLHGRADDAEAARELERASDQCRRAVESLRNLIFELRPPALDRDGLAAAVRLLLDELNTRAQGVVLELRDRLDYEPASEVRAVAYRIVQEAVTNVTRHSGAVRAVVDLCNRDDGTLVRILDDGVGFVPDPAQVQPGHVGLIGMRERAELAGGWCRVVSARGEGTSVEFWLPDAHASASRDAA